MIITLTKSKRSGMSMCAVQYALMIKRITKE